jgi:beta-1,4-mannosyltransferase
MKILIFPYEKNPYQRLLYRPMRAQHKKGLKLTYLYHLPIFGALHIPFEILIRRCMGYRIIHIHWQAFFIPLSIPGKYKLSLYACLFNYWWMKFLGYNVIWTVHDIVPHDPETSDDLRASRKLAEIADVKIVHSSYSIKQMRDMGLNTDHCVVIPHGNYIGVYPDRVSRKEARTALHIAQQEFVFLFFGIIRAYKGIDTLLSAYSQVATPHTRLVIAGKCMDENIRKQILAAQQTQKIDFYDEYVATEQVATFYTAADAVCLPFKSITTSGSVLLALTFGKTILAPRSGALRDIPKNVGYLYEANNHTGLTTGMLQAMTDTAGHTKYQKNAIRYAESLNWEAIAEKTYGVYQDVWRAKVSDNS